MKTTLLIMALAGTVSAAPVLAQDTAGEDLIGSVMGILALGNSNSLGSEAVEKYFEIGVSEIEINSWDLTDTSGTNFSGEGGTGESSSAASPTERRITAPHDGSGRQGSSAYARGVSHTP